MRVLITRPRERALELARALERRGDTPLIEPLLTIEPVAGAAPERPTGPLLRGFMINPRRHPDFGWAWLTRFLMNLGNAIALLYLLYFLDDAVGVEDPEGGVFVLTDQRFQPISRVSVDRKAGVKAPEETLSRAQAVSFT